jgi:4-amino-4-deoxy-L-arabinose transferase-like glycosyltransferase
VIRLAGAGNQGIRESGNQGIRESGNPTSRFPDSPIPDSLIPAPSFLCLLILLLAWALRLYQLEADSLWGDEIFTATQSPLPTLELLRWTAGDIHPPGYYLIVGRLADWSGWAYLPPSALTDWLWRFPSAVVGILAVALTYRVGTDLLGRQIGLAGALLLAVSPVAIQYSQEARMHGLFLLGVALSTWTLTRALASPGQQWAWWLAYALATALSLYTVYLAFVVLAAQGAWVIKYQIANSKYQIPNSKYQISNSQSPILGWLGSVALAFVLYLPWWPTLLGIVNRRLATGDTETGVGSPLVFLVKGIYSLGPSPGWAAWLFLGLWVIGVVSVFARRDFALALFAGLWLVLPLALPFVFQDPRALHLRYVFLLPVYLLFVAQGVLVLVAGGWGVRESGNQGIRESGNQGVRESGNQEIREQLSWQPSFLISRFPDPPIPRFLYTAVFLGLTLVSAFFLPEYYQRTKPDWRGVGAYLMAETIPGDVIVTGPLFDVGRYLDYYYDGPAELLPPAFLVVSLPNRVDSMRASGGRVWAVTRFQPAPMAAVQSVQFHGLTISEPVMPIYEVDLLEAAMVDLMQQAVTAAPNWAAEMAAEGVMTPDPMVARAAAYLFLGDVYRVAGRLPEAVAAYKAMVADYPSAGGYVALAEAYEAAGRPEAAVRAYQRAVALNPTWQESGAEDAQSLADAGHWAEAAAAYRSIVR